MTYRSYRPHRTYKFCFRQVTAVVNHQPVVDDDGLETLLFPLLVPVAVFSLFNGVADVDTGHREVLKQGVQLLAFEQLLLNIAAESVVRVFKSLETNLSSQCASRSQASVENGESVNFTS